MLQERDMWVDNIKIFACVLVTLGHFFQSMTQAAIIPVSAVTQWFNATVYYFHVPLFFLCSGYVHQRFNRVTSFSKWKRNLLKKAVTLGIPYFGFSLVTWGLKYVFSGAVNTPNEGLLETLFVTPGSPYWFLYILFILFAITPALNSKGMAIAVAVTAVVCKGISIWGGEIPVYAVSKTVEFGVWFVAGMVLAMADIKWLAGRRGSVAGGIMAMAFLAISTVSYAGQSNMLSFAILHHPALSNNHSPLPLDCTYSTSGNTFHTKSYPLYPHQVKYRHDCNATYIPWHLLYYRILQFYLAADPCLYLSLHT